LQAQEIKNKLKLLIEAASVIDPDLAKRLTEINRWVKDVKTGSLTAKRFVILFLQQIITDAEIWLDIKKLVAATGDWQFDEEMTPTEKYWYSQLFPKWLSENDPKFYIWRQKLMSGDFHQEDTKLIDSLASLIKQRGGTVVQRYVADLSMATDIIVSSRQEKPLCTQLTSISQEFSPEKSQNWEVTLRFWQIDRGLFLNYTPGAKDFMTQIVNIALYNGDNLNTGIYLKFNL
jgi:hypothetical protein